MLQGCLPNECQIIYCIWFSLLNWYQESASFVGPANVTLLQVINDVYDYHSMCILHCWWLWTLLYNRTIRVPSNQGPPIMEIYGSCGGGERGL